MKLLKYIEFDTEIYESYLKSNFAPMYHLTDTWALNQILDKDILQVGWYQIPINKKERYIKTISLTRNKNLNLDIRKVSCRIVLDNNLLKNNYTIRPYDFYINNLGTTLSKIESDKRVKLNVAYESEEYIDTDIKDLHKYIISIEFLNIESFYLIESKLIEYIIERNLEIDILLIENNKSTKLL